MRNVGEKERVIETLKIADLQKAAEVKKMLTEAAERPALAEAENQNTPPALPEPTEE